MKNKFFKVLHLFLDKVFLQNALDKTQIDCFINEWMDVYREAQSLYMKMLKRKEIYEFLTEKS